MCQAYSQKAFEALDRIEPDDVQVRARLRHEAQALLAELVAQTT